MTAKRFTNARKRIVRSTVLLVGLMLAAAGSLAAQENGVQTLRSASRVAEPFSWIRGLIELPDGRLLVADQREKALYITDLKGAPRRQIGSNGAGPQEYDAPIGLMDFRGDSILLNDLLNNRYLVVTADSVIRPISFAELPLGGAFPDFLDGQLRVYSNEINMVLRRRREDPNLSQAALRRHDADGTIRTMAHLTVQGTIPLFENDRFYVAADGSIAIARNQDAYRLDWVRPDGTLVRGQVIDEKRIRIPAADARAIREGTATQTARSGSVSIGGAAPRSQPDLKLPDHYPFVREAWIDSQGQAWVHRYQTEANKGIMLDRFDRQGRRTGRFFLQNARSILGFGRETVYAGQVDDDGLTWVHAYPVSNQARAR